MKVKPLDQIASKWASRAAGAGQAYTQGVQNPKNSWATQTANAANNWANGVQAAVTDGRFAKGVQAAGDQKWSMGATTKGATRYPDGVRNAQPFYQQGFSKFATALTNFSLPARFPKGSPQNMDRSSAVATLLRNVKLGKTA